MGPDLSSFDDPANATQGVSGTLGTPSQHIPKEPAEPEMDSAERVLKRILSIVIFMFKNAIWLILLFGVMVWFGGYLYRTAETYKYPEIGLTQYDEIAEYSDSFPGLKDTVKKLLVNDGIIDDEEFISIKNVKNKLRREEKRKRLLKAVE
jgi:hypothetical protein